MAAHEARADVHAQGFVAREKSHSMADRGDDFYASPVEAVSSLLRIERDHLPAVILEPACGDGAIVNPLRAAGYTVHASDLIERGCPDSQSGVDFLMPFPVSAVGGVVSNPPYKIAQEFIERSLHVAPYVAMLLRLSFLASQSRREWFQSSPLARVHVSSRRLPMMHRGGWEGPKSTSATEYAWFVWDKRHEGRPSVQWFDWKGHQ